jgi:hypothetical protein
MRIAHLTFISPVVKLSSRVIMGASSDLSWRHHANQKDPDRRVGCGCRHCVLAVIRAEGGALCRQRIAIRRQRAAPRCPSQTEGEEAGKKRKGKKGRKAKAGKSCGTYMYRKGGKCLDARNKK